MVAASLAGRARAKPVCLFSLAGVGLGLTMAFTVAGPPLAVHGQITDYPATLAGVSGDSPSDAWAIGQLTKNTDAMALHWNGKVWTQVSVPDAASVELDGVTALAPDDVWAVGSGPGKPDFQSLALRWNGTGWTQVATPNPHPGESSALDAVGASSQSDVWAVGYTASRNLQDQADLALHWNGTTWTPVPTPTPGPAADFPGLDSVSADSPSDAWAIGTYLPGQRETSFTLHWDGTSWKQVPLPSSIVGTYNVLSGVAAISPTDAWATGTDLSGGQTKALLLHWNGTAWQQVPIAGVGGLGGVSAASATDIWAIGPTASTMLHWNGTTWAKVPSPDPRHFALVKGVSTVSSSDAWAAGCVCNAKVKNSDYTLLLHWNGTSWRRS
jgi:hypothetical protein